MTDHTWIRIPAEVAERLSQTIHWLADESALEEACRSALDQELVELSGDVEETSWSEASVPVVKVPTAFELVRLPLYGSDLEAGPVRILIVREGE